MAWISVLFAGIALALVVWVFVLPLSSVQRAGRRSLPVALRLLWPWIQFLAAPCGRLTSWAARERLSAGLHRAGLAGTLQVSEFAALRCCLALSAGGLFAGAGFLFSVSWSTVLMLVLPGAMAGFFWPLIWLHERAGARRREMLRELPFFLDMTTLCVQAGLNLHGALTQAAQYGPEGALRSELEKALLDMRAGMPRMQSLDALADRTALPEVRSLVLALHQADQLGISLGPMLQAQATQRRQERYQRAEKQALQAPVKMLFPMVICIFPCTFLVIGFPLLARFLAAPF